MAVRTIHTAATASGRSRRSRDELSGPSLEDVIYRAELDGDEVVHHSRARSRPGWTGYARRVDADLLREVAWPAEDRPLAFVCGPTSFVESVAADLSSAFVGIYRLGLRTQETSRPERTETDS
jgi:ferredoxin-NADP reductase